jgi:membrane-bound lytic murein transglycosylase F
VLHASNPSLAASLDSRDQSRSCAARAVDAGSTATSPLLDDLNQDKARFGLVDGGRFRLWQPFFDRVRPAEALPDELDYRWFWNPTSAAAPLLRDFWRRMQDSGELKDLLDRYYGFLPEETDYFEIGTLAQTLRERVPERLDTVRRAARASRIDPLLLLAVIYQESRFDTEARSRTGVRGLMQLTGTTAAELGVDRQDPDASILGGARYLKGLYDRLEGVAESDWDRWFLALAAYNQGLGHVLDAARLAEKKGGPVSWRTVREALPLLLRPEHYAGASSGRCSGAWQAIGYVESIRYYHYVLHGLVTLARPEAEHLGPLVIPRVASRA